MILDGIERVATDRSIRYAARRLFIICCFLFLLIEALQEHV